MSKPYTTDTRYRLAAVVTHDGRRGVAAFGGLWDTGGTAWVGREKGRLYRLPRVSADAVQLWVPLAWTEPRGEHRRVARVPLPCGLDVGRKGRGTDAEGRPVVADVYALRSHAPEGAAEMVLVIDVDGGRVWVEDRDAELRRLANDGLACQKAIRRSARGLVPVGPLPPKA